MALSSRGTTARPKKVVKLKKASRRTTESTRNHRFRSFSERISTLKIDPVRRKRYVDKQEEAVEISRTYFGQALQEWRDTNTTETFSAFAQEASPLCDSLAMVLHNQQKIMDVLVRYIERSDALALEPLLSLLSHFAHDLDVRFETHFERAVATVTAVAAAHKDFDVIEWSFTCLAWLFKYLSRLLTPDLRPLYRLLTPYLGKKSQKPFVIRFTAEALSFLLRKAAVSWERDPEPLTIIMAEMLEDGAGSPDADMYHQGIMTLLTEAVKGVQNGIHLCGMPLLQSLLKQSAQLYTENYGVIDKIVNGVLTSLIHHCNTDTFGPIVETVIANAKIAAEALRSESIRASATSLFTIISVRKGSRISDWRSVMGVVGDLLTAHDNAKQINRAASLAVLTSITMSMQTATLDAVNASRSLPGLVREGRMSPYFLQFCDLFARAGRERFQEFGLPEVQNYVLAWSREGVSSSVPSNAFALIPQLAATKRKLSAQQASVTGFLADLRDLLNQESEMIDDHLARWHAILRMLACLKLDDSQARTLEHLLLRVVERGLEQITPSPSRTSDIALGPALSHLLDISHDSNALNRLWPSLCSVSSNFIELPGFWSNCLRLVSDTEFSVDPNTEIGSLESAIVDCLSMPSHSIRHDALHVLQRLYRIKGVPIPDELKLMLRVELESKNISLDNIRQISMHIRDLGRAYSNIKPEDVLARAVPSYCFGLLYINLAQAWTDAIGALSIICESKTGEEMVTSLAQKWIEATPPTTHETASRQILDLDSQGFQVFSDFECPNLAKMSAICEQVFDEPLGGHPNASEQCAADLARIPAITANSRGQALRILSRIPKVAEKRSRLLVPILLRWAGAQPSDDGKEDGSAERWSRKDQKEMLEIFAQFTNPKVLFKSQEVYDALLNLCANGDVEIQRSALRAILAWKNPAITGHAEHLTDLLDDARFREELQVFFHGGGKEAAIDLEDHEHLMPVLLRLLYGKAIAGSKDGSTARRKAIFTALADFGEGALGLFVDIAMSSLKSSEQLHGNGLDEQLLGRLDTPLRQQVGLLNMLNDMLQTLGAAVAPLTPRLMNAILACIVSASRRLEQDVTSGPINDGALLRSVRQTGTQCLVKIYSDMNDVDLSGYEHIILEEVVQPRLQRFAEENSQSISGTLRLFGTWSQRNSTAQMFSGQGSSILPRIAGLLQGQHTVDEVQLFILQDIIDNLADGVADGAILQPYVSVFVKSIGSIIQQQPSKVVLDASVKSFSLLATRIVNSDEAADVVKTCSDLLKQPDKSVPSYTKSGLLRTLIPLMDRYETSDKTNLYDILSALFSRLRDAESRALLAQVFVKLTRDDFELSQTAIACQDMNARSTMRMDEPDHDRRESAFAGIFGSAKDFSLQQWRPILHNCLYFIRDPDDRVNRSSASHALGLFVDVAAEKPTDSPWVSLLEDAVFLGIEKGMRARSELVRAEYLFVLGRIVEKMPSWTKVKAMQALVVGGDDEASFFTNVLHIQHHRRLRALRRLSDECAQLNSNATTKIFLPLLEHFVFDQAEGDAGRTLSDQAVQTIGAVSKSANWSSFRMTFHRYASHLKPKTDLETPDLQKTVLRLLGAIVDGLNPDVGKAHSETIIREILPSLQEYLHLKDESTVDRRMPVAVTIVKLLLLLPPTDFAARLPAVLTDVSHVLRSRSQEARDQTRKALARMSSLVGAQYFRFILKELRSALQRGYQLHVLSFTVHSLLVSNSFGPGDLDECLSDLMLVIIDDIFGVTGQEKDAEDYKSGMKEIKSSKSYDTMELLARVTPVYKLGELIRPIRDLLSEKIDLNVVKKIDDLLSRLRKGIDQNPASESRDMLSFCWEVASQDYMENKPVSTPVSRIDDRRKRYIVQPEAKFSKSKTAATSFRYKLVSFALDLLRKILRRHEELQTVHNLGGFLPIAGDALVQNQQEEVKISAVRFLSTIMKVPMPHFAGNVPVYIKEAVSMIEGAADSTADAFKAALELITSILREQRSSTIKEKDIAIILKRIKADIDQPDRQGVIYRFLRAIVGRKIVVAEVYEIMDEVGQVMIKNEDRPVRESARSAYLQFVMEFPQGKGRWEKQIEFLRQNLQYKYANGRQSVMEFLNLMLSKLGDETFDEVAEKIFVTLVFVMVNDQDASCREMAHLLVGKMFERTSEDVLGRLINVMDVWLQPAKKAQVKMGALKCWSSLLRADRLQQRQIEVFRSKLQEILLDPIDESGLIIDALQTLSVLVESVPAVGLSRKSAELWLAVQRLPMASDERPRELVAELLNDYFADFASNSSKIGQGLASLPLRGSGGLELGEEDLRRLCAVHVRALRAIQDHSSESLVTQINRNVFFLGRIFAANGMEWQGLGGGYQEDEDDSTNQESDEEEDDRPMPSKTAQSASAYLLTRLSRLVQSTTSSPSARLTAATCIDTLIPHTPLERLPLSDLLRPVNALVDTTIPHERTEAFQTLEKKAHEILDAIQKKVGNETFLTALNLVQREAKARRDVRRQKRRIEAVSMPEKSAKEKKRRYEAKKARSKAKGEEARGRRRGW